MTQTIFNKKKPVTLFLLVKIFFLLIILFLGWQGIAKAQLMVVPTRVVFEGRVRSQEVHLINKKDKETTYRITFQHLRMKPDGSYEEIKEAKANEQFADELVRYSPRRVALKPGKLQTIRLMVRKPKNLPAGEYRSHLLFREVAPSDLGVDIEREGKKSDNINVRLIPLFGVSIPVIVRHGKISAEAEIREAKVMWEEILEKEIKADGKEISDKLFLKLRRSGKASLYGDIAVTFTPEGTSRQYDVAGLSGVAVFCPNESRDISMPLKAPDGVSLKKGKLHIVYKKRKDKGANILTAKTLILPQGNQ